MKKEIKFKTYNYNNPPKEKVYGIDFSDIPVGIVNVDLKDVETGDIFKPVGEDSPKNIFSNFDYKYLIAEKWGDNKEFVFRLYTNNPKHYYNEEDLKTKFVNCRIHKKLSEYNNRKEYNIKILKEITSMVYNHPDLRFFQILTAMGIVESENIDTGIHLENKIIDKFHEESEKTYKKLIKK